MAVIFCASLCLDNLYAYGKNLMNWNATSRATLWCSIYNELTPMADDVEELEILSGESTVGGSPAATAMVLVGREEGVTPLKHRTLLNQFNL